MKEYNLLKLLKNKELVDNKIKEFELKNIIERKQSLDEIKGHMQKAQHNLEFVKDTSSKKYADWAITGCYYACYHAALSLILTKGYFSKNHQATLLILIKEFYEKELTKEEIETISQLLNYQDVLFYVESKNKREDATYSTKIKFTPKEVEDLRIKAILFVSKVKSIIEDR
ncbi:DNA-binding protein [Candidatus Woesearchaeota archaeon CG10_big_fil_rev_8_21_14_0_10_34_8]|nr:MAG: DNA-binding protein [Candidatus Woesearchaeota archaeon CG10_big_fil_rev_8_21_14_0_10_34_8]